eukprot:COSAG02_NODE_2167_length_9609_cov_18.589485_7_plen_147_part_00
MAGAVPLSTFGEEPSIHPFLEQNSIVVHLIYQSPCNDGNSGPFLCLLLRRKLQDSMLPVQVQIAAESICAAIRLRHIGCHLGLCMLRKHDITRLVSVRRQRLTNGRRRTLRRAKLTMKDTSRSAPKDAAIVMFCLVAMCAFIAAAS